MDITIKHHSHKKEGIEEVHFPCGRSSQGRMEIFKSMARR